MSDYTFSTIKMWRKLGKILLGVTAISTAGYSVATDQQRENVYGAYRSIVNSSRAAIILYRAVNDYELSLMGL